MKNEKARLFLSDSSKSLLESSAGTRNVVKKQMLIDKCKGLVKEYNDSIEKRRKKIDENLAVLEELKKLSLLKKLFSLSENKRKRDALTEENGILSSEIKSIEASKESFERDIQMLEGEIAEFAKVLAEAGVTPEEIMVEYFLILKELEENEKQIEEAKAAAAKKPEQVVSKPKTKQVPSQNKHTSGRMSQIDRFNARLRKHEEMKANSSENAGNNQPGDSE